MTTPTANYNDSQLSALLKAETAEVHNDAENQSFMVELLNGKLTIEAVAELTGQLYFIYEVLEEAVRANRNSPELAAIYDERLERLDALRSDLTYFYGPQWQDYITPLPETTTYVKELQNVADNHAASDAVAHHYVRYLGDMSGGQVIASRLEKYYRIPANGAAFYDFDAIGRIKPYRDTYRINLNELELDADTKLHIVDVAKQAFKMNEAIFKALGSRHRAA